MKLLAVKLIGWIIVTTNETCASLQLNSDLACIAMLICADWTAVRSIYFRQHTSTISTRASEHNITCCKAHWVDNSDHKRD